ncbi:MAG: hypothetical protein ACFE9N_10655, partial [Promethearchaeota archaeon]
ILKLELAADHNYLNFILPLLNDPDDSVRWAVIRFLNTHKRLLKNPLVYKELKNHVETELNPVIKEKIMELFRKV